MSAGWQLPGSWQLWVLAGFTLVALIVFGAFLFSLLLRRYLRSGATEKVAGDAPPTPRTENEPAFVAASMQAVIQKLREQEKELERLHRVEKDRAAETERLTEAVLRNMPTGMLLVNAAGLITLANPAAEAALGLGALGYRRYSDVLGGDSLLAQMLSSCLGEGRTFHREELEHRTTTGEVRHLGITVSPIFPIAAGGTSAGRVTGALCLLSDLTELTTLQRQMRLRESLAALGEMSAGIAHEFKNALATISGYAQMLRDEAAAPDQAESAQRILAETRTLTHVVTEFLRYARPFEIEAAAVGLRALVERVVAEIGEAAPSVHIAVEGEFTDVAGDDALLRQALLNLIRNAAEAVAGRSDGRVVIHGSLADEAGHAMQRIAIRDNGAGISSQELPKIFLPFYTTKTEGTGLGLAIVQKIAVQHGGSVEARNLPEGGAEVILWLPLRRENVTQAVDSASARI